MVKAWNPDALRKQVNASGFPFQLRVQHEVKASCRNHCWKANLSEVRWEYAMAGEEGFIDLVFEDLSQVSGRWFMVVECKRVAEDRLVFIVDPAKSNNSAMYILRAGGTKGAEGKGRTEWYRGHCGPASYVSSFCALPPRGVRGIPTLEKVAGALLYATEAFAFQARGNSGNQATHFVPVIVTNAELVLCTFPPDEVDLNLGKLPDGVGEFEAVNMVRFQKSFGTFLSTDDPLLEPGHQSDQRTVLVIQASWLARFLAGWDPNA